MFKERFVCVVVGVGLHCVQHLRSGSGGVQVATTFIVSARLITMSSAQRQFNAVSSFREQGVGERGLVGEVGEGGGGAVQAGSEKR